MFFKRCEKCLWWIVGYRMESEKIGKCVKFRHTGVVREDLRDIIEESDGVFAFTDSPHDEPVYTSYLFSCARYIPNTPRGKRKMLKAKDKYDTRRKYLGKNLESPHYKL